MPKTQDEAVYNVVADTFDEVVMKDNKRDILIELYASWCGHCAYCFFCSRDSIGAAGQLIRYPLRVCIM